MTTRTRRTANTPPFLQNGNTPKHSPFGDLKGEQFGGSANRLQLQVNEAKGPFTHVKIDKDVKLTADTEPVDIYVANYDGEDIRMPAASIFRSNAEEANLNVGDEYHVARLENTTKKKGRGKGREMEVYVILVTKRNRG